jgi:hypothetical protein
MSVFDNLLGSIKNNISSGLVSILKDLSTGNSDRDLSVKVINFGINGAPSSPVEGQVYWDSVSGALTYATSVPGTTIQAGQELVVKVTNETGTDIDDGKVVYILGASTECPAIVLADASDEAKSEVIGITTSSVPDGGEGFVAAHGIVHDIDLTGFTEDASLYLSATTPGAFTTTAPSWPNFTIRVGTVIKKDGNDGDLFVAVHHRQQQRPAPICFATYTDLPVRNAEENQHGGLLAIDTAHDLSAGDLVISNGVSKIALVLNAGSDYDGEITVTGTEVDSNTGVQTPGQTSTITVDALTTDTSAADGNGIVEYNLANAYITDKWFTGSITIASSDTAITDMDTYQLSFEQFNDASHVTMTSTDLNVKCLASVGAKMSAYLYTVIVNGDKVTIEAVASRVEDTFVAGRYFRSRHGNLDIVLDGSTDGIFMITAFLGTNTFADAGVKIWADILI